ncbi:YggS family pyridoxal phosphate-dependent enzyme [Clostridium sp. HMP27]|uniref:YggS family pyridoxal phosphate-dependent enzyme n=1 Tax=Clostridium sp. HMP27 TaxID=1487921 RepID=UPI00052C1587|nr:YggS family pyridoxal phosphate-dependent enzyme [Clostridium sp. HMP27]KGK86147.1 alanine racemase [Clostridium sp. HMP27]
MSIAENVININPTIPSGVKLIAVSKTKPLEDMDEAYQCGIRDFGENKVQELMYKIEHFNKEDVTWHLIGHLQRNKVKYIVGKVNLIHSLDSIKLLEEIEKQYAKTGLIAHVLIEINIGKEQNKSGIMKEDLEELLNVIENCNYVNVEGLMTVIPIGDENSCRIYFKEVKNIFDNLSKRSFKNIKMKYLSMGMTGDYKIAIEEGSNMVRIGQGIFGKRDYTIINA